MNYIRYADNCQYSVVSIQLSSDFCCAFWKISDSHLHHIHQNNYRIDN